MTAMEIWNNSYCGNFTDLLYKVKEDLGFPNLGEKDLTVSKEGLKSYWLLENRVVSNTEVLRMQDMDLILSLMAAIVQKAPLHKDEYTEELCRDSTMEVTKVNRYYKDFMTNMDILKAIIAKLPSQEFSDMEFHKKHDFYSLFCAIDEMRRNQEIDATSDMTNIAHNLEVFNMGLRSFIELDMKDDRKTVPAWNTIKLPTDWKVPTQTNERKPVIPVYFNSRTRDWNHNSEENPNRSIRMDAFLDIMRRRNKISMP
jgi:hypothetical protein